jgi:hypothetical protein
VDQDQNVHLLQRIDIKDGMSNRRIVLPDTVAGVERVRIWCAFAETNLGEAVFGRPVVLGAPARKMRWSADAAGVSGRFTGVKADPPPHPTSSRAERGPTVASRSMPPWSRSPWPSAGRERSTGPSSSTTRARGCRSGASPGASCGTASS